MKSGDFSHDASRSASMWPRLSWIAGLLFLTIAYRIGAASADNQRLWNTAPLVAMCFGGGLLLGFRFCWVPALLLVVSDLFLGLTHGTGVGVYTLTNAIAYTAFACIGAAVGRGAVRSRWWVLLVGTLSSSVLFYALGNTWAWMASPEYAKTLAGWWQSQTVGIPGPYPPSLFFLRNALIGDSIWCLLAAPLFFWNRIRLPQAQMAEAGIAA